MERGLVRLRRHRVVMSSVVSVIVTALSGWTHSAFTETIGAEVDPVCPPRAVSSIAPLTSRDEVDRLVKTFLRAFNKGKSGQLDELVAAEPDFEWYSVAGERTGAEAEDRSTLIRYFRSRHRLEERLLLVRLKIGEERGWHGGYDFFFKLRRSSSDAGSEGVYRGKGAASCSIFVWSMGPAK